MFAGNDCFRGMLLVYNDRRLGGSVESIIISYLIIIYC